MRDILGDLLYTDPPNDEKDMMPSPEFLKGKILVKAKRLPPGKGPEDEIEEDDTDGIEDLDEKKKEKPKKISQKLSDCVNYIHAVHFHGFDNQESKYYHMSSFGESKAFKFIEDTDTSLDFVKYNCRQISRIYPGAKRQDSSNLKVVPPWNAGCQIGKAFFEKKKIVSMKSNCLLKNNILIKPSVICHDIFPSKFQWL